MTEQQTKAPIYLTTEELALRYQLHPVTIKKWRQEGKGPKFCKIGSRVLYPIGEVHKWDAERTVSNTAQSHLKTMGDRS